MINLKPIITASAVLLLLNACSSSSTGDGAEISVLAASGVTVGLNGTYSTGCHGDGDGYVTEDLVISGNTWNYTSTGYTTAECSGTGIESTAAVTLVAGVDSAITGWVNGSGESVPLGPTAADDSGPLGDGVSVTTLDLTITGVTGGFVGEVAVGDAESIFYVVDDTGANNMLYRDDDFEAGSTLADNFDPFTKQ